MHEQWRFESISNQLVIYSPHKPCFPHQGRLDHQWHYSGKVAGQTGTAISRGRPSAWNQALPALGLTLHAPIIPHLAPIHAPIRSILARIVPLASRSEWLIRPAKCEACIQHDKRDVQWLVLNRHRQKLQAHKTHVLLPNIPPDLHLSSNTWLFPW
jgi:hypothetical protein